MQRRIHIFILALCLVAGCGSNDPSSTTSLRFLDSPPEYPLKCVYQGCSPMSWQPDDLDEVARAGMLILPAAWCFSPDAENVLGDLAGRNPDLRIIGYQLVLGVSVLDVDTSYLRRTLPFYLDYYNATTDDWAFSTTGDTLMMWPGQIMLNPISGGAVNRRLIMETVDMMERYRANTTGRHDGVMHDYFMDSPFINPFVRPMVDGSIDLDGNGILFGEDALEQALFVEWQKEYAREIRNRFGDDFIQIANGRLPQDDAELAGLLNGIFYEVFPNMRWNLTDRDGLLALLGHQSEGYLAKAAGRTWSIVSNEYGGGNNLFCLLASMFAGCFYTELHGTYLFTGWTLEIDGGRPLGPGSLEGRTDSLMTVQRRFERGVVRMRFNASGARIETVFEPVD